MKKEKGSLGMLRGEFEDEGRDCQCRICTMLVKLVLSVWNKACERNGAIRAMKDHAGTCYWHT